MSLAWHLAADAHADLRRLDGWLQEEVLDEFERLASDSSPLPAGFQVYDFERASVDTTYKITLTLDRSVGRRRLTLLGIEVAPFK